MNDELPTPQNEATTTTTSVEEALFREVIESMEKAIAIYEAVDNGADFVFVEMNGFAEKITHYKIEDVLGKRVSELFPGELSVGLIDKLRETWQTGNSTHIPLKQYVDNRIIQWVENYIYRLPSGNVVAMFEDTFEQHAAEMALKESEQKFRSTVESISDGFFILEKEDLIVTYFNRAAEALLGRKAGDVLGEPLFDAFPEARGSVFEEQYRESFRAKKFCTFETYFETEPYRNWYDVRVYPGKDGISVFFQVTTERKQVEEEIRQLSRFPSENPNPVLRIAEDGTILYANKASVPLLELWDRRPEERLADEWQQFIRSSLEVGEPLRAEVECGDSVFSVTYAPVLDSDCVNVYGLDITEGKRAEEELRKYRDKLEHLVRERTQDLQEVQERLIRQEKLATLGQLAGGVGHELRNPLGAIKNATYFLNMVLQSPDAEIRETLDVLDNEVESAERIISGLLDFARTNPPERHKVDLNDVIKEALSRTPLPGAPRIEMVLQLDDDLPPILADPHQLSQVFGNIVRNGIQAMPGSGRLLVRTALESAEWVTISVTDTGEGISEKHREKIFEPLFTTKAKGIGLGLAVVKTIVEGHGGSIEVESEIGQGTTFIIKLPVTDTGVAPEET